MLSNLSNYVELYQTCRIMSVEFVELNGRFKTPIPFKGKSGVLSRGITKLDTPSPSRRYITLERPPIFAYSALFLFLGSYSPCIVSTLFFYIHNSILFLIFSSRRWVLFYLFSLESLVLSHTISSPSCGSSCHGCLLPRQSCKLTNTICLSGKVSFLLLFWVILQLFSLNLVYTGWK